MSIEEALLEIEAQQFIGRRDELALIERLLERARSEAAVAYAYGPRGVGKTALLRAAQRAADRHGLRTIAVAAVPGEDFAGLMRQISGAWGIDAAKALPDALLTALASSTAAQGILLIIDDYDALGAEEDLVRTRFLYRLPPGTAVLLAGRLSPTALWPLERAWRSFVERLPLSDLPLPDVQRLLLFHGIEDEAVQSEAHRLTGGRPALITQVADRLAAESEVVATVEVPFAVQTQDAAQGFILEQLVHPGSRRAAWRMDTAIGAPELVLQAASLLPYFNRSLLTAMLGEDTVREGWKILERLPCSLEPGNWHRLHEDLRQSVAAMVARERPWLRQVWLHRAIRRLLMPDWRRGQAEDGIALRLLFELGEPAAAPRVKYGMTLLAGIAAQPLVAECLAPPWLRALSAIAPQGVRVLLADDGTAAGAALTAAVRDLPAGVVPPGAVQEGAIFFALAAKERSAVGPLLGLLAAAAHCGPAVVAIGLGAARGVFEQLGLRPIGEDLVLLEPHGDAHSDWLHELAQHRLGSVATDDAAGLAKEALQAIAVSSELEATRAAAVYRAQGGRGGEPELRRWLLDALQSAEIGETPCSRRQLLRLYYVDKAGSHEDIAERLDLPRASYFRTYREALAAFGAALCGHF